MYAIVNFHRNTGLDVQWNFFYSTAYKLQQYWYCQKLCCSIRKKQNLGEKSLHSQFEALIRLFFCLASPTAHNIYLNDSTYGDNSLRSYSCYCSRRHTKKARRKRIFFPLYIIITIGRCQSFMSCFFFLRSRFLLSFLCCCCCCHLHHDIILLFSLLLFPSIMHIQTDAIVDSYFCVYNFICWLSLCASESSAL